MWNLTCIWVTGIAGGGDGCGRAVTRVVSNGGSRLGVGGGRAISGALPCLASPNMIWCVSCRMEEIKFVQHKLNITILK